MQVNGNALNNVLFKSMNSQPESESSGQIKEKGNTAAYRADSVELSSAVQKSEQDSGNAYTNKTLNSQYNKDELYEMLENANKSADSTAKGLKDKLKCLVIAMRIINGDKVPLKDERFLAENEREMYARAIMLRQKNKDPKEYKSLLDDEEDAENSTAAQDSATASEAASASADVQGAAESSGAESSAAES